MSTSNQTTRGNAFTRWVLDEDGDWWGDEQERMRRYEGIALMEHAQMILFPSVMAVMAWTCPKSAAPWLLAALLAFLYPTMFGTAYVLKRHVRVARWRRNQVLWTALSLGPIIAALAGLASKLGLSGAGLTGSIVGGVVLGLIGLMAYKAQLARRARSSAELD
ncbi:MAG: hypothetical protein R3F49_06290 [Planctomycetota bacterium]